MKIVLKEKLGVPTDILAFPDSHSFLVATSNGYVLRYERKDDIIQFEEVQKWRPFKRSVRKLAFIEGLVLVANTKGKIVSFKAASKEEDDYQVLEGDEGFGSVSALVCTTDELFIGNDDGDVFQCTRTLGKINVIKKYDHHDDYISSIQVVSAKKTLLVGSGDGTMSVIDLKKKKVLAQSKNFDEDVTSVLPIGASGKVLLGTSLGDVKVFKWNYWGAPCDSLKSKFHENSSINDSVFLSHERRMIATAGGDGKLRILSAIPLACGTEVLTVDDSLERLAWISNDSDDTGILLAISADEPAVHVVSITDAILDEAAAQAGARKSRIDSDSDADSDSDSDSDVDSDDGSGKESEEEPKPKKQKKEQKQKSTQSSGFFKDLD